MSYADTIQAKLEAKLDEQDLYLQRDDFNPDDPAFKALVAETEELTRSHQRAVEVQNTRAAMHQLVATAQKPEPRPARAEPADRQTLGDMFTRSDVFTGYPGRGTSSRLEVLTERALPMGLGTVGDALPSQRITLDDPEGPAPLLGLIPAVQVSANAVEVITWEKTAGGAAIVPEGQSKPSAEWAPTSTPITLDTIAVYTQMTRQLLEDAPAVRSLIDSELRSEVTRKLESEAAAALAGATLPAASGADLLKAIRVAVGTVQAEGFTPNVVLLNPADWAELDVTVLGQTLLGPSVGSQFWGLRPVASVAQPAGTAVVGDFTAGAARYTRTGVSLYITDSHADTFTKNVFTLLAETRAKTVVTRASAFATASATP